MLIVSFITCDKQGREMACSKFNAGKLIPSGGRGDSLEEILLHMPEVLCTALFKNWVARLYNHCFLGLHWKQCYWGQHTYQQHLKPCKKVCSLSLGSRRKPMDYWAFGKLPTVLNTSSFVVNFFNFSGLQVCKGEWWLPGQAATGGNQPWGHSCIWGQKQDLVHVCPGGSVVGTKEETTSNESAAFRSSKYGAVCCWRPRHGSRAWTVVRQNCS